MTARFSVARRQCLALTAGALAGLLGGCVGGLSGGSSVAPPQPVATAPAPAAGPTIGAGSVKVALLLPLTGPGANAATSLRNAAELALAEFQSPNITLLVKDDQGTADGAREAASQAIAEGAELLIGPLFAPSVGAAGAVARQAGRPVIAFSTDATVAARGVYLIGFLPGSEVDRIIDHAASQGRRSVAALIPETAYGNVVEAQFREAAARRSLRVAAIERYPAGGARAAVGRIAPLVTGAAPQADALFIPETPEGLAGVGAALQSAGFNPAQVKPLGTRLWDDPRVLRIGALQGAWFAAPDPSGFAAFAERYRARYGSEPLRIATLSYDAVSVAAALDRTQGTQRFSEGVLTNSSGFVGADGLFRFRPDGTNDRGLAVMEVRNGAAVPVSAAPRALGSGA